MTRLITRVIEHDIVTLTALFRNFPLFCNCPLPDFLLATVKRY